MRYVKRARYVKLVVYRHDRACFFMRQGLLLHAGSGSGSGTILPSSVEHNFVEAVM